MELIVAIGFLAGICTTISTLPEVVRVWRLKEARDISIYWCLLLLAGTFLWSVYGYFTQDLPILLANGVSFALVAILFVLKSKFDKRKSKKKKKN